jgi:hypothetical protein
MILVFDVMSHVMTPLNIRGRNPAWDSSGDRLVYDDSTLDENGDPTRGTTHVFNLATKTASTVGAGNSPSWWSGTDSIAVRETPRMININFGSIPIIAFRGRGRNEIDLVSVETRNRIPFLPATSVMPRWSPDGQWMMYSRRATPKSFLDGMTEPQTIVLRNTQTQAEMTLGDVPGLGNSLDYAWVKNEKFCQAGLG